jgi:hypothetical protein
LTLDEINKLSRDELLDLMRREGLQVVHSMFATIHHGSDERPDGYTGNDLDEISDDLEDSDVLRWRRELVEHFASIRESARGVESAGNSGRRRAHPFFGDVSWLSVVLMVTGGLSLIDVLESAIVQHDLSLITPFEVLLHGYQRMVSVLDAVIVPLVEPIIYWVNDRFRFDLSLHPVWRPVMVLWLVYAVAAARLLWKDGQSLASLFVGVSAGGCGLLTALGIAFLPFDSAERGELPVAGWIAVLATLLAVAVRSATVKLYQSQWSKEGRYLARLPPYLTVIVLTASYVAIAGLGADKSSNVVLGVGILVGVLALQFCFEKSTILRRVGVTMIGGYVAAALILLSDWIVKAAL